MQFVQCPGGSVAEVSCYGRRKVFLKIIAVLKPVPLPKTKLTFGAVCTGRLAGEMITLG